MEEKTTAERDIEARLDNLKRECNLWIILMTAAGIAAFIALLAVYRNGVCVLGLVAAGSGLLGIPLKKQLVKKFEKQLEELRSLRQRADESSAAKNPDRLE